MKAKYTKPMLALDVFSASQSTARDCMDVALKEQFTFNDPGQCFLDLGGGVTVFVANGNCMIDGESAGYGCYNNPGEGNYAFRS